jgi:hypothetical protein
MADVNMEEGGDALVNGKADYGVIDIELDLIDDKEFEIPPVDKAPTLESILSAPDDDTNLSDGCVAATEYHSSAAVSKRLTLMMMLAR